MLLILLASIGLTHIIVHGKIAEYPKSLVPWAWLKYLLDCYQCSGVWAGAACAIIAGVEWREVPLYACASSVLARLAVAVIKKLERTA